MSRYATRSRDSNVDFVFLKSHLSGETAHKMQEEARKIWQILQSDS